MIGAMMMVTGKADAARRLEHGNSSIPIRLWSSSTSAAFGVVQE